MNYVKSFKIIFNFCFITGLIMLLSCQKTDTTTPVATPTGIFMFHLHTYIDFSEVDAYNITYTTLAGRKMSLSLAQMYISDVQLVKLDGSTVSISGKKILKTFEQETVIVGEVPVGNYKSFKFKVGLDATTNASSPSSSADTSILNRTDMWFSSTAQPSGYVFMNVQGKIDTTTAGNGTAAQMQPFVYKIGTNANYTQITMSDKNFTVVEGQPIFGHLIIDYSKLFSGIALNQSANLSVATVGANTSAVATKIVNNIPSMFSYEQ